MTAERLKALTLEGFERMFNDGDLDYVEQATAPGAVDHQEPEGSDYVAHLKEVTTTLRIDVIDIARFRDGRLVEHWGVPDRFAILEQLGWLKGPTD